MKKLTNLLLIIAFSALTGCSLPKYTPGEPEVESTLPTTPLAAPPETIVTFQVEVPISTPESETVYLCILDEITGLALNAINYPMQGLEAAPDATSRTYIISLPFAIKSIIKYRYERQSGSIRVAEHTTDNSPVRYRLYYVQGQGTAHDVISRWTDTAFEGKVGRIIGKATDLSSGLPIPNLLVTAGGSQTITTADGTFLLEGLPAGIHNLVAYAMDGSYKPFQQEALIAPDSTTPTPISMAASPLVTVVFVVRLPSDTPPAIPVRIAGNLIQLGNSYGSLKGGISAIAANMPTMKQLPDGRFSVALSLPESADIRYKYTIGDGFWNAEHTTDGEFRIRQAIVPAYSVIIEDEVETWSEGTNNTLSFDVTIPDDTPSEDFIAIQFNPLIGWTEPIPMWQLGPNRWAYILYSPLSLPGNFSYRYCRNSQCGYADDIETPGLYGAGRPIVIQSQSQTMTDQVTAWNFLYPIPRFEPPEIDPIVERTAGFWAGVELVPDYHPSWRSIMPRALDDINNLSANWLVIPPTWTYGYTSPGNSPPVLAPIPGSDPLWYELAEMVHNSHAKGFSIAIKPTPNFLVSTDEWWLNAPRDIHWWSIWFDQYREFLLHHAEFSARTGVNALILGGDWLQPALPGGRLADGSPSGVPEDAAGWWSKLIEEVKGRFSGRLLWSVSGDHLATPPSYINQIDQFYISWTYQGNHASVLTVQEEFEYWLDSVVRPFQTTQKMPVVLNISIPSVPDAAYQLDLFQMIMEQINLRPWVGGISISGYFPPTTLIDNSPSVHGKPSADLIGYWFPRLLGIPLP